MRPLVACIRSGIEAALQQHRGARLAAPLWKSLQFSHPHCLSFSQQYEAKLQNCCACLNAPRLHAALASDYITDRQDAWVVTFVHGNCKYNIMGNMMPYRGSFRLRLPCLMRVRRTIHLISSQSFCIYLITSQHIICNHNIQPTRELIWTCWTHRRTALFF